MIRTKASLEQKVDPDASFNVVVFDAKKRRLPKTAPPKNSRKQNSESEDSEFERVFGDGPRKKKLKKDKNDVTFQSAKRDIINFGIAGSSSSDKIDLNQQLAIKLGAKPAKKSARNYKEILEEKRNEKELDKTINKRTIFGTSASLQYRSQKKAPKKDGLLKRYGKVEKESKDQNSSNNRKRKR